MRFRYLCHHSLERRVSCSNSDPLISGRLIPRNNCLIHFDPVPITEGLLIPLLCRQGVPVDVVLWNPWIAKAKVSELDLYLLIKRRWKIAFSSVVLHLHQSLYETCLPFDDGSCTCRCNTDGVGCVGSLSCPACRNHA